MGNKYSFFFGGEGTNGEDGERDRKVVVCCCFSNKKKEKKKVYHVYIISGIYIIEKREKYTTLM